MKVINLVEQITHISPDIVRYLDYRLEEWADWALEKDRHGLNYPSTSIEYHLMTLGCLPLKQAGSKRLPAHESAEEMEAIIHIMATQDQVSKRCALALREYYLGKGRTQAQAAQAMGVSERNFCHYLKEAYTWLAGWFTREYASHVFARHIAEAKGS